MQVEKSKTKFLIKCSLFLLLCFYLLLFLSSKVAFAQSSSDWFMAGANPARASRVSEEVSGNLKIEWYRPIEAYLDTKIQIVAANGLLYVSTGKGLYALDAATGDTRWTYLTELPLGHSPTVVGDTLYVGGLDRRLYALNATTGVEKWIFSGALAGYSTNPVVVNDRVYLGNRDGYFYAVDAQNGQQVWRYPPSGQAPIGSIRFSAAYENNVLYFATNDLRAYALNAQTGNLIWRSEVLPGERFQSYWPVIYRDFVVFAGSDPYKNGTNPGSLSVNNQVEFVNGIQRDDVFYGVPTNGYLGSTSSDGSKGWPSGVTVMDADRILEYLEYPTASESQNDPTGMNRHNHKPWRRTTFYLRKSDGSEYTFDSDGDGLLEYVPNLFAGTKSGNHYPPMVNPDTNAIYQTNHYHNTGSISGGRIMGWKPEAPRVLAFSFGQTQVDEPQAFALGGSVIYRTKGYGPTDSSAGGDFWSWCGVGVGCLEDIIPGWSPFFCLYPGPFDYVGGYCGKMSSSINGIYRNEGEDAPPIPYNGRVYIKLFNTIIALGPQESKIHKPDLLINGSVKPGTSLTATDLQNRLADEIQKIINAGILAPGYYNDGIRGGIVANRYRGHDFNFDNPGDTLATLSNAYLHLSFNPALQSQLKSYLQTFFQTYYSSSLKNRLEWTHVSRSNQVYPPEVAASMTSQRNQGEADYAQQNIYALYKYAQVVPSDVASAYSKAKSMLKLSSGITTDSHISSPWKTNDYIAAYIGFLKLQEMAGQISDPQAPRQTIQAEHDRLVNLAVTNFHKDHPWTNSGNQYNEKYNLARNFIYLTPELGDYLNTLAYDAVKTAIDEYTYIGPMWFVSAYEGTWQEGQMHHLQDSPALFQAKAWILKTPSQELTKYLDVATFDRGDLFYIQNLIATLEAPGGGPTATPGPSVSPSPTPTPAPGDANGDGNVDGLDYVIWLNNYNTDTSNGASDGDFNNDGNIDGLDYVIWLNNYGV